MWAHEIYGFHVTETELQEALEAVRAYVADAHDKIHLRRRQHRRDLVLDPALTLETVTRIFQSAIDRGRTYDAHTDIHVDGPTDAPGL